MNRDENPNENDDFDPNIDLKIKPDKRAVLSCLFLVLPFFAGVIACIVLLVLDFGAGWGFFALALGLLPVLSYSIYVKAREKQATVTVKRMDVSKYDRRAGTVISCEVSSYKPGYSTDPRPNMYRIKVDVGGVKYTVYGNERYGVGEPCTIYVKPSGGFAQIVGRGDGASALKSETVLRKQMTAEEDAFLDELCDKCDDATYDLLYDAWSEECDRYDSDEKLTRSETQTARYEASAKYRKLISECYDECTGDKSGEGFLSISRERLYSFLREYDMEKDADASPSRKAKPTAKPTETKTVKGSVVPAADDVDKQAPVAREQAETPDRDCYTAPRPSVCARPSTSAGRSEQTAESEKSDTDGAAPARSRPTVGYKGINRKK